MAGLTRAPRRQETDRHEGFLRHGGYRWAYVGILASLAALMIYRGTTFRPGPSGGTWFGYATGVIATLVILWLTALGIRKRAITAGVWSLKGWLSAHVYLGLTLIVVATLHTGFAFGWNVHTLAYGLMMLVIVSGLVGVVFYATLPRKLSANRGEATEKQMLEAIRSLDRQLFEAAQGLDEGEAAIVRTSLEKTILKGSLWRRLANRYGACGNVRALAAIEGQSRRREPRVPQLLTETQAILQQKAERLAQMRRHIQIRAMLEAWLYVHVPATFALLAALTAHIISVFFYW